MSVCFGLYSALSLIAVSNFTRMDKALKKKKKGIGILKAIWSKYNKELPLRHVNRGLIYKTSYCFSRMQALHKMSRCFNLYNKKDTQRPGLKFSVGGKHIKPILTVFYVPALGDWVPILHILASSSPVQKGLNRTSSMTSEIYKVYI